MMTQEILTKNPLGSYGKIYTVKKNSNASIYLNTDAKTLEFYPVGYTKHSDKDYLPRQNTLKYLFEQAVSINTEQQSYPLDSIPYNLKLVHIHDNASDQYALRVVIDCPHVDSKLHHLDSKDIGWSPKRISRNLTLGNNMITGGRILKIKNNWHNKYYTCKVIFSYGINSPFRNNNSECIVRFINIMDEM